MNEKIYLIRDYILRNPHNPPTNKLLCEKFTISDYALRKGFKRIFNNNIGEYGRKFRIREAAKLLINTDYTISTIGEYVGFSNASRFAEAFRNQYGLNPFSFRSVVKNSTEI
jgi:AraC-like DNA-binding protein